MGPGPEREQVAEALVSLRQGAQKLDVTALRGRAPWARLRVGSWGILFRPAGDRLWVERIVNRRDLAQAVRRLS